MRIKLFIVFLFILPIEVAAQEWVSNYQSAQNAYLNGDLDAALATGEECLKGYLAADGSLSKNYASILRLLTTVCYASDNIDKGINYGTKELQIRENLGEDKNLEYATSLYNLGALYEADFQHETALATFQKALEIYKQYYQPNDENIINCKWKIASNLVSLDNDEEAYIIYQETLRLTEEQETITMEYINACSDYANLLLDKKDYNTALNYFLDLENIYLQLGSDFSFSLAQVYTNLGLCKHHMDKFAEAEAYYSKADELLSELSLDGKEYLQLKNLRAVNFQSMGQADKASELLEEIGESDDVVTKATALNNEAILKQQAGDLVEAKNLLNEAINLLNGDDNKVALAETLENLSSVYLLIGKADSARVSAEQALNIKSELDELSKVTALNRLAEAYHALGEMSLAEQNFNRAIEILNTSSTSNSLIATVKGNLAVLKQDMGDYGTAEMLFDEQIKLLQNESNSTLMYATALNNAATLKQIQAEYLQALNLLNEALQVVKSTSGEKSLNYASVVENLSLVQTELGNFSEAELLLNQTLEIRKSTLGKSHPLYASTLQNLGRLKQQRGKYQEAEPLFVKALKIKEASLGKSHPSYAFALNNMALLYQTMGNFNQAEPLFEQTANVYKVAYGEMHPEYATALENLATIKKLKGNDNEAAQILQKAVEIDEQVLGTNHPRYATALHNLASTYKDMKRYEEAASLFSKALKIDKNVFGEEHPAYASTLYNLAVLQQELKQIDSAEINFIKALDIREKAFGKNHPDYAYSLYGLAGLYHLTGAYTKAKTYYDQVIGNYLQQIDDFFPSLSEKEKSAFYGKIKPVIESYQDFAIEYANSNIQDSEVIIGDLYNLQLSTKALLLHASNKVRNRILNSSNPELIDNYQKWTEMKEMLSKYLSFSTEELSAQNISIENISNEINQLEKYLSQQSESFADEIDSEVIKWNQIAAQLEPSEAAVEILRIKKRYISDSIMYVALIVKPANTIPEYVVLNEGTHLESRYFNYYRNAIKFTVGDEISYQQFWAPIDAKLHGIETVFASADGVYNKININTLFDPKENKYVIDEYNVRSVSNTKEIVGAHQSIDNSDNIAAVFGFPDFNIGLEDDFSAAGKTRASRFGFSENIPELPGTDTEVNELNKLLSNNGWQTSLFTREKASETQIKQVNSPKLMHVATHGFFMPDIDYEEETDYGLYFNDQNYNPLFRSGLLLAGAANSIYKEKQLDDQDGILTAYEAMNLDLDQTSLVVLSACETGVGEVKNGEGVYGLQRAFIVAGAESVIMSLWQVDDYTTQRLMILFYENWLSGQNKFEAFKNASKKLKEEFKDPYHWGAFVILGVE